MTDKSGSSQRRPPGSIELRSDSEEERRYVMDSRRASPTRVNATSMERSNEEADRTEGSDFVDAGSDKEGEGMVWAARSVESADGSDLDVGFGIGELGGYESCEDNSDEVAIVVDGGWGMDTRRGDEEGSVGAAIDRGDELVGSTEVSTEVVPEAELIRKDDGGGDESNESDGSTEAVDGTQEGGVVGWAAGAAEVKVVEAEVSKSGVTVSENWEAAVENVNEWSRSESPTART
ncbi:hypothetical protein CF326_g8710 [Tilletia indica]|nr:hypothetical protein CF326_g8710 [Tilletia indica]